MPGLKIWALDFKEKVPRCKLRTGNWMASDVEFY